MVALCCYAVAGAPEVPLRVISLGNALNLEPGGVPLLPHIHLLSIGVGPSLVQGPVVCETGKPQL